MDIRTTGISGVLLLTPRRFGDSRGWLAETYAEERYRAAGIDAAFVQDNVSLSETVHTVRGLHFQRPPFVQAKLVQVLRGRILDVAVDLRPASPTFGKHVAVELDAADGTQIFVPGGFAHGYCTLEPGTLVHYKCSARYAPAWEGGLLWHDPALGIDWPPLPDAATVSDRDRRWPALAELGPQEWE